MIRNVIIVIAIVGLNFVALNWYKNEAYKLDSDSNGDIDDCEIAKHSHGVIPGLSNDESDAVRVLCDKNKDGRISCDEMQNCLALIVEKATIAAVENAEKAAAPAADDAAAAAEATRVSIREKGKAALLKLKNYDYRGLFEKITTSMRKHKVASIIAVLLLLVPLHFAGALPRIDHIIDSVESTFSKIFEINGADSRKDFISYVVFVVAFIVVPAGYVFADTYDVSHTLNIKEADSTKWAKLTKRVHAGEITLFCFMLFTACVRRIRSTGHSVLVLVPYFMSVVALDITDLVPTLTKESFPQFLQPVAGPLVNGSFLANIILSVAIPTITLFILVVLPEEDDGAAQAAQNREVARIAADLLKTRPTSQYYLRSCPAVVPASVSNLLRILSNGNAQIDAIIPAIITAFFPLSGYFLQGRVGKAVVVLTLFVVIWFDFYERHLRNLDLNEFAQRIDIHPDTLLTSVPGKVLHSMIHPEAADRKFHHSLFNHIVSSTLVCLFQFFDVLTFKNPSPNA